MELDVSIYGINNSLSGARFNNQNIVIYIMAHFAFNLFVVHNFAATCHILFILIPNISVAIAFKWNTVATVPESGCDMYDVPNGSLFISILLHNSEARILSSEICTANFGIRNCEIYVVWSSGNSESTLEGILNLQTKTRGSTT